MSRIIFINRFYHPDEPATAQLLGDLAEALARRGETVLVLTSCPPRTADRETRAGVDIHRIAAGSSGQGGLIARAGVFVRFWFGASVALFRLAQRGDRIVALTDPPLIGIFATLVARLRGARIVHWVQDLYPEVAQQLSPSPLVRAVLGAAGPFRTLAWRRSDACITLGSDMAEAIRHAAGPEVRIDIIRNWPPAGVRPCDGSSLRKARGLDGRFVVAYSGNLGRVHGLEALPPVIERIADRRDVVFTFTGGGARRNQLQAALAPHAERVRFFEAEPRSRLAESLAAADAHWVTLRPGAETVVFPSKFAGILAAGKPVLFVGPTTSELARLVRDEQLGAAFAPADSEGIAHTLRQWADEPATVRRFAERAAAYAARHATLDQAVEAWARLLANDTRSLPHRAQAQH